MTDPLPGETPAASPTVTPPAPSELVTPQPTPTGENPTSTPAAEPAMVPSDRLREETEKRRQAEQEAEELRQQLEARQTPPAEDDDLDPETEAIIRKGAKKLGLISQQELAEREIQTQVRLDVKDLESQYANSGVPYVHQDILKYAKDNAMPITSKASLRAAYRDMNADKIQEIERQRIVDELQGKPKAVAELGGSSGSKAPQEEKLKGNSPKERTLSRIARARQNIPRSQFIQQFNTG